MLGRLGTGSAVGALPLAGLLWAASSSGRTAVGVISAVLLFVVLAVTFAPWIPLVRSRMPAARRLAKLEAFWVAGHKIVWNPEFQDIDIRSQGDAWEKRTGEWIETHISAVEAERFRRPGYTPYPSSPKLSVMQANRERMYVRLQDQLDVLLALRDEQRKGLQ